MPAGVWLTALPFNGWPPSHLTTHISSLLAMTSTKASQYVKSILDTDLYKASAFLNELG